MRITRLTICLLHFATVPRQQTWCKYTSTLSLHSFLLLSCFATLFDAALVSSSFFIADETFTSTFATILTDLASFKCAPFSPLLMQSRGMTTRSSVVIWCFTQARLSNKRHKNILNHERPPKDASWPPETTFFIQYLASCESSSRSANASSP